MDLTRRSAGKWIVDFDSTMSEVDAALYEGPFAHVAEHVRPMRRNNPVRKLRDFWWRHEHRAPSMWLVLSGKTRYIATPTVSKHRVFAWLDPRICPDHQLTVIARDDDTTFGILHSRFNEAWSLRLGTSLEDRPRYTPTTTFETFPFPRGLAPNVLATDYAADRAPPPSRTQPSGWSSCATGGSTRQNGSSGWTSRFPAIRHVRRLATRPPQSRSKRAR